MRELLKNKKPDYLTQIFYPKEISEELCKQGLDFIHRRFFEEWGVVRSDVEYQRIYQRSNIILYKQDRIVGWLGIENDNEFTTACVQSGENGVVLLRNMIDVYVKKHPSEEYFAYAPIEKTASARAFLMAGWSINKPDCISRIKYLDKVITLIKLVADKNRKDEVKVDHEIEHIRRLNNECNSRISKVNS